MLFSINLLASMHDSSIKNCVVPDFLKNTAISVNKKSGDIKLISLSSDSKCIFHYLNKRGEIKHVYFTKLQDGLYNSFVIKDGKGVKTKTIISIKKHNYYHVVGLYLNGKVSTYNVYSFSKTAFKNIKKLD